MSHPSSTPDPHVSSPDPGTTPDADARLASPPEKSGVWLALVAGHFGAAVYVFISVLSLVAAISALSEIPEDGFSAVDAIDPVAFGVLASVGFVFALLAEAVTIGLHRRHKWAWFAGLAMFGFYLFSPLFLLCGAMGMCGLLMRGSRREFGMSGASGGRRHDAGRIVAPVDPGSSPREGETTAAPGYLASTPTAYASSLKSESAPGVPFDDAPPPAKSRVWIALVGGHLGAAFHVVFAIGTLAVAGLFVADIPDDDGAAGGALVFGWFALFSLALAIVVEVITIGMHRRRPWAWFAGFAMFALYLAFFLPIGAIGLCGLLTGGSRRDFGMG